MQQDWGVDRLSYVYRAGKRSDEYIILCVWSLTAEIVKVQRRCRKIEAGISGDQCRDQQSFQCCKDTWGTMDVRFHNVEIEEFCNKLTQWERYVLAYLCQDDWEKRLPFGFHFSKFVKDTQALLNRRYSGCIICVDFRSRWHSGGDFLGARFLLEYGYDGGL